MSQNPKDVTPSKPATPPAPKPSTATFHVMPPDAKSTADLDVNVGGTHTLYKRASDGSVMVPARAAEEIIRRGGTLVG